jgi:hypothetical protein
LLALGAVRFLCEPFFVHEKFLNRSLRKNLSLCFGLIAFFSNNNILGTTEEHDDHLASRFCKTVEAVHRIAGICQIVELAWNMVKLFIERYGGFVDGSISNEFLANCESLFLELYASCIENN